MTFLNRPRKGITCYCFVNLNLKKIFIVNHKCGITYFNQLFRRKYLGETGYIKFKEEYQFGDWYLAINPEEIQNFARQYDEREFAKMMITRNPYDRVLSFFTNTFWDVGEKRGYMGPWRTMTEDRFEELADLKEKGDFKKGVKLFFDVQWINPTKGAKDRNSINYGYGDEHLVPQSAACEFLTDVEFIDLNDAPPTGARTKYVMDFLDIEVAGQVPVNRSSNSRRVLEDGFFDDLDLTAFNEFYRDDFGLGYKICNGLSN